VTTPKTPDPPKKNGEEKPSERDTQHPGDEDNGEKKPGT